MTDHHSTATGEESDELPRKAAALGDEFNDGSYGKLANGSSGPNGSAAPGREHQQQSPARVSFDSQHGSQLPISPFSANQHRPASAASSNKGKERMSRADGENQGDPLNPLHVLQGRKSGMYRSPSTRMSPFVASPERMSPRKGMAAYASSDSQTSLSPAASTSASSAVHPAAPEMRSLQQILQSVDLEAALKVVQTLQSKPVVVQQQPTSSINTDDPALPRSTDPLPSSASKGDGLLPALQIGSNIPEAASAAPSTPRSAANSSAPGSHQQEGRRRTLSFAFAKPRGRSESLASQASPDQSQRPSKPSTARRSTLDDGSRTFEDQISRVHLNLSPQTLSRAQKAAKYFSMRYDPVFQALEKQEQPPNLLSVSKWRMKIDENERRVRKSQIANSLRGRDVPDDHGSPFDGVRSGFSSDASAPARRGVAPYGARRNKRPKWFELYPDDITDFVATRGVVRSPQLPPVPPLPKQGSPHTPPLRASVLAAPPGSTTQTTESATESSAATSFAAQKRALQSGIYGRPQPSRHGSTEALPELHPLHTISSSERHSSPLRHSQSGGSALSATHSAQSPYSGPSQLLRDSASSKALPIVDERQQSRFDRVDAAEQDDDIASPRSRAGLRSTVKRFNPIRLLANETEALAHEQQKRSESRSIDRRTGVLSEGEDLRASAASLRLGPPKPISRSRRTTPGDGYRSSAGEDRKRSTIRGRIINAARSGFKPGGLNAHTERDGEADYCAATGPRVYWRRGDAIEGRQKARAKYHDLPLVDLDDETYEELSSALQHLSKKSRRADDSLARTPKELSRFMTNLTDLREATEDMFDIRVSYPYPRLSGHVLALVAAHAGPPPRDSRNSSGEESDTDTSVSSQEDQDDVQGALRRLRRRQYRTPTVSSPQKRASLELNGSPKKQSLNHHGRARRQSSAISLSGSGPRPGTPYFPSSPRARSKTISIGKMALTSEPRSYEPARQDSSVLTTPDRKKGDMATILARLSQDVSRLLDDVTKRASSAVSKLDVVGQDFAALQREADRVSSVVHSKHVQRLRTLEDHFDRVKTAYNSPELWNATTLDMFSFVLLAPGLFIIRTIGLVVRHWRLFAFVFLCVLYDARFGSRVVARMMDEALRHVKMAREMASFHGHSLF